MQESPAEVNSNKEKSELDKCIYIYKYEAHACKHLVLLQEKIKSMLKTVFFSELVVTLFSANLA